MVTSRRCPVCAHIEHILHQRGAVERRSSEVFEFVAAAVVIAHGAVYVLRAEQFEALFYHPLHSLVVGGLHLDYFCVLFGYVRSGVFVIDFVPAVGFAEIGIAGVLFGNAEGGVTSARTPADIDPVGGKFDVFFEYLQLGFGFVAAAFIAVIIAVAAIAVTA